MEETKKMDVQHPEDEVKIDPVTEAKKVLEADERKKQDDCAHELNDVLLKYGYKLDIVSTLTLKKI